LNTDGFKKRLQPVTLEWRDRRFPNSFELDPWPKPQNNLWKKHNDCIDDFRQ